ncbi:MAG: CoB--CoM heterodisulfide reductase iron-sulfur subunit A family protein [Desulfobacterales bacterium]|nr:MAG: CoB--CoM heterodisulfide reductase iron-sulfur subunit A family protein [Desulfobacterales bacterium]
MRRIGAVKVAERIGIYICECGPNIKDAVDIDEVVKFAQGLDHVVLAKPVGLLCSEEGKALISSEIKKKNLTRVVFAACSPKEHEITFKKILRNAGLNPFLFQISNIREHCAWVINDKPLATDKAKAMINAAVRRVVHHEPLEVKEMECQPDVLVVGAGMAGISAALTLAQRNRKVYLVEKLPCIGGKVALYEDVFPNLECASCVLDPLADEVLHHEQIQILTCSEVEEVLGFYGNFVVKVNKRARFVDMATCIGCEACFDVCPVKVSNEYNEGLDERRAIYIPYAGALPNVAVIDKEHCLRWQGEACAACQEACAFGCINYEEADQVEELKVGAIVLATGFDIFDPRHAPQYGYGKIENVYTSLEFERLVNPTGPTEGKIVLKNGQPPERIALVHCVGSRTTKFNEHCSGVCCMYLLKFSHQAARKLPGVSITELYSDLCLPGKESQRFFHRVSGGNDLEFLHMKEPDSIEIREENGKILIQYSDVDGRFNTVTADMVVLAPAIEGARDAGDLAEVFDISQGEGGFFVEDNSSIAPVSTARDGVFITGCAQGPKDIQASVADGQAAAGKILSRLIPGEKLVLEAITAETDIDLCSGCKVCIALCPYKAITYDETGKHVTINEVLCRGCGVCPAACPSGAIKAKHFADVQISAEIKALTEGF